MGKKKKKKKGKGEGRNMSMAQLLSTLQRRKREEGGKEKEVYNGRRFARQ